MYLTRLLCRKIRGQLKLLCSNLFTEHRASEEIGVREVQKLIFSVSAKCDPELPANNSASAKLKALGKYATTGGIPANIS